MSVIVPVYNVEEWLALCLDSVAAQTVVDWECIVIIDGSPDGSEQIAREMADTDSRFTVISVPNGGLGSARNIGLETARGRWVFFLDSDDVLPEDALEALVLAGDSDEADLVCGVGLDLFDSGSTKTYWTQNGETYQYRRRDMILSEHPALLEDHVVWNKIYRRSFVEALALRFTPSVHCEDLLFSALAATQASSISVIPSVVYFHRRHSESISADYLRDKTLTDWMGESRKAFEVVKPAGPGVFDRYVENFVARQWWTRAQAAHRIGSDTLLEQFETFSSELASLVDGVSADQHLSLEFASLEFASAELLSTLWRAEGPNSNPLQRPEGPPAHLLETILRALHRLDLGQPSHKRLVLALMAGRVVPGLVNGGLRGDRETGRRLLRMARDFARLVQDDDLAQLVEVRDGSNHSLAGPFELILVQREAIKAHLAATSVSVDAATFNGEVELPLLSAGVSEVTLVLRSQSSKRVRTVPVSWRETLDSARISWSATVRLEDDYIDQEWRCWLRVQRAGFPSRDILLTNSGSEPSSLDIPSRRRHVSLRLLPIKGIGAPWVVMSTPVPSTRQVSARHFALEFAVPTGVFTFPNWHTNPYLTLLELEPRAQGREMVGSTRFADLILELRSTRSRKHVHIHWTSPVTEQASTAREAENRVDQVLDGVRVALGRGRKVMWTVHNALPHDSLFADAARRLHRGLASTASMIHVLSKETSQAVSADFSLPESRTRLIPHASYIGVYGSSVPTVDARAALGADVHAPAVLFFGQLRPYKGMEHLVSALSRMQDGHGAPQLLLAGKASPQVDEVLARIEKSPIRVTSALRFIGDDEVSTWFSAASVAVLPYRDILNSGTMQLAASFGVPCVLPALDHLVREFSGQPWIQFFALKDPAASIEAILREGAFLNPEVKAAALDYARANPPIVMSRAYATALDALDA